jgi:hypothetical protein
VSKQGIYTDKPAGTPAGAFHQSRAPRRAQPNEAGRYSAGRPPRCRQANRTGDYPDRSRAVLRGAASQCWPPRRDQPSAAGGAERRASPRGKRSAVARARPERAELAKRTFTLAESGISSLLPAGHSNGRAKLGLGLARRGTPRGDNRAAAGRVRDAQGKSGRYSGQTGAQRSPKQPDPERSGGARPKLGARISGELTVKGKDGNCRGRRLVRGTERQTSPEGRPAPSGSACSYVGPGWR